MLFYSTNKKSPNVLFVEALTKGLAPDGGLYFPTIFPQINKNELQALKDMTLQEVAIMCLSKWIDDEFTREEIQGIVQKGLTFPIPITHLGDINILELFHGPTLAFKDIAAGILGQIVNTVLTKENKTATVLVATSGDTGAAVAQGFSGMLNVKIVIVYPNNKVSKLQEEQITRTGENVTAIAINGDFDDCQRYVKQAFLDPELAFLNLTSANSVNIGRLIPQSIFYFYAYAKLQKENIEFVVPSGNLGNVTAGLFAYKMGLPVRSFIIASNDNDAVVEYTKTGRYIPKKTVHTLSTAMDIGSPSNFIRIQEIFNYKYSEYCKLISATSVNTKTTIETIKDVYHKYDYLLDPHTAVGYTASRLLGNSDCEQVVLATASPLKFAFEIFHATDINVDDSHELLKLREKKRKKRQIENSYIDLKEVLINS